MPVLGSTVLGSTVPSGVLWEVPLKGRKDGWRQGAGKANLTGTKTTGNHMQGVTGRAVRPPHPHPHPLSICTGTGAPSPAPSGSAAPSHCGLCWAGNAASFTAITPCPALPGSLPARHSAQLSLRRLQPWSWGLPVQEMPLIHPPVLLDFLMMLRHRYRTRGCSRAGTPMGGDNGDNLQPPTNPS